jgi:hypothetical protein
MHFHGYQPGDIVYRKNTDPKKPLEFEERKSPVSLFIDKEEVAGQNWTDAAIKCYAHMKNVFEKVYRKDDITPISIDIEPYTLMMVLQNDLRNNTTTYKRLIEVFSKRWADPIVTIPFHPIMPHLPMFEQEILSKISLSFFKPIIKSSKIAEDKFFVTGMWLPEACYSEEVGNTVVRAYSDIMGKDADLSKKTPVLFLILDSRQFVKPTAPHFLWSCNYLSLSDQKVMAFGRDQELSDAFAFNTTGVENIVNTIAKKRIDGVKEKERIPYMITMASDLEALLSDPVRSVEFRKLIKMAADTGITPMCHAEFVRKKLADELKRWDGECTADHFEAHVRDYSSWSDYSETLISNKTSDTRWTGLRRTDGRVISRNVDRTNISQIWKGGYIRMLESARINIRRWVIDIISDELGIKNGDLGKISELLVNYNKVIFRNHYLEQGYSKDDVDFEHILKEISDTTNKTDTLAMACRAYYEMLMAHKSCPLFWDSIDTRVTFQNIVLLSHSFIDVIEIQNKKGLQNAADDAFKLFATEVVDFKNNYTRYSLNALYGLVGWETTKTAWIAATQSRIHDISMYDVVKRAALFVATKDLPDKYLSSIRYEKDEVVADTAHIEGEVHGKWANKKWCEHQQK